MTEAKLYSLQGKKVLITGGSGFFGKSFKNELSLKPCDISGVRSVSIDLIKWNDVSCLFNHTKPDIVIHLAGYNGGIKYNIDYPSDIFLTNTMMATNIVKACIDFKVQRLVSIVASCAWNQPLEGIFIKPEDILKGQPDETVSCHGFAKRNLFLASRFAKTQYGLDAQTVCVTTMYGRQDTFDPSRTKVVGALIKKIVDAKENKEKSVVCWGDGTPLRQILFVEDAARALVKTIEYTNEEFPVFIAGENNILSIKEIAETIADVVGFDGKIEWDKSKPNGQHAKCMKNHPILDGMKWTSVRDGLKQTVEYYSELRNMHQ